jgi:hypothetical protein
MSRVLFRVAVALCIFFLFVFSIFMFNQFTGLADLAGNFYPQSRNFVLYGLSGLYLLFCVTPVVIFFIRPAPMRLPENHTPAEQRAFYKKLKKRLRRNKILKAEKIKIRNTDDMEAAFALLDEKASRKTRKTASKIFITTALSQNGKLDSIIVFAILGKLVWDISKIYNQRSSASDMIALYSNVAATTFFAGAIEEMDIQAQIDSIMSPVLASSALGMIPGASGITSIITSSLLDGSANAFLALRIGIMTRDYFNYEIKQRDAAYRRKVMAEAGKTLLGIAVEATRKITGGYLKTVTKTAGHTASSAAKSVFHSGAQAVKFSAEHAERFTRYAKRGHSCSEPAGTEPPCSELKDQSEPRTKKFLEKVTVVGWRERFFKK